MTRKKRQFENNNRIIHVMPEACLIVWCFRIVVKRESGNSLNQGGSFHSGSIGADHYSLNGREISDKICGNSSTSSNIQTTATIGGQCGQGVTIELNANDGESATFTGNADCTVNRSP